MNENIFTSPEKKAAWIFGQPMNPCPKCRGFNMIYQTPIQIDEEIDLSNPKQLLGIWARARKDGHTPLRGDSFLMCRDCGHHGPSVDVSGRTAEDVGQDPVVAKEIKRLWNDQ